MILSKALKYHFELSLKLWSQILRSGQKTGGGLAKTEIAEILANVASAVGLMMSNLIAL